MSNTANSKTFGTEVMPEDFEPNFRGRPRNSQVAYVAESLSNPGRWIKFNLADLSATPESIRANLYRRNQRKPNENWSVAYRKDDDFLYIRCNVLES